MALASALDYIDITRRKKRRRVKITPSGNYVAGGDTLDLTKMTNPNNLGAALFANPPKFAAQQNAPGGYAAEFIPGATLATCKVKYSVNGAELAAGAYPAVLTGDTTTLEFITDTYTDR